MQYKKWHQGANPDAIQEIASLLLRLSPVFQSVVGSKTPSKPSDLTGRKMKNRLFITLITTS